MLHTNSVRDLHYPGYLAAHGKPLKTVTKTLRAGEKCNEFVELENTGYSSWP